MAVRFVKTAGLEQGCSWLGDSGYLLRNTRIELTVLTLLM